MNCFVCGTNNEPYSQLKFLSIDEAKPIKLDLHICQCGFAYYRHNEVEKLYNENSKYTTANTGSGAPRQFDEKRLQNSFSNISGYLNVDDTVLDVGCNNGTFLEILFENGCRKLTGTDFAINRDYTAQLEKSGVKIHQTTSLKEISTDKFDFITANHVLEHVEDIKKFIGELEYNLKDGGYLYIEVPDASRYNDLYFQPFSYFDLEHINHFSIDNLSFLLREHGFEILESFSFAFDMNASIKYPGIGIVARKNNNPSGVSAEIKVNTNNNIEEFYKRSLSEISNYNYKGSFDNIVIYGVGANTLRTLGMLDQSIENVCYFVDKNELFHERSILNKKIKSIAHLLEDNTHPDILIFSKLYYGEIVDDLRKKGIKNNIYSFF